VDMARKGASGADRSSGPYVLVTGGLGYVGSHMVLELVARGHKVVVLDDLSTGVVSALPAGVPLVIGDVADTAKVAATITDYGVDAIAHFAAKIVVPESVNDPLHYYYCNTVKSRALVEAAVRSGVRHFIFSSTAAVYGDVANNPVSEAALTLPRSPYGRSKLMTEWMLEDAARAHDFRFVALRYFNVAGADPRGRIGQSGPNATHLIKVAMQAALGRRPSVDIYGADYPTRDGTCERDFIHVTDLARAHIRALDYLRSGGAGGTFNCGYGRGYSVKQIIDVVKKVSGVDFEVRLAPRRPGDPAAVVADNRLVCARLGWRPELDDIEQIVRHAFAWECRLVQGRHSAHSLRQR